MVIGIVASHREEVVPTNPEFQLFFEALRLERCRTELVDGPLTPDSLRAYGAILVGAPRARYTPAELDALRAWVRDGGSLLVLARMGGDAAAGSNLGPLLGVVRFDDVALGRGSRLRHGGVFDTQLPLYVRALTGSTDTLCYDTGCTFSVDETVEPSELLRAPRDARVVDGVRQTPTGFTVHEPSPRPTTAPVFVRYAEGAGRVLVFGAAWSFKDGSIVRDDTLEFAAWLFLAWLPEVARDEVASRQLRAQRHRLLHGYPMEPLLRPMGAATLAEAPAKFEVGERRDLVVGVLPHPFCNPKVRGCGFCTFPHELYSPAAARETTLRVAEEVKRLKERRSAPVERPVRALYFGGGTANLGDREAFRTLCRTLREQLKLDGAEVTLEGVPAYHDGAPQLLDLLREELGDIRPRVSMGVQTFDPLQLQRMGRTAFGDYDTVRRVVERSREAGVGVSADLLFNLPGQTLDAMTDDLDRLLDLGLEHVGLYHLVLFDGLGTEWSRDRSLLAQLPDNEVACERWLTLRARLAARGYVQRTLTNFERADAAHPFEYERRVFTPERHDWLGFGPSAITLLGDRGFNHALKLMNPSSSADYGAAIDRGGLAYDRVYEFDRRDLQVLYVTRKVARLRVPLTGYRAEFGTELLRDFAHEVDALQQAGLIAVRDDALELTERGTFFADTVAGTFAWRKVGRRDRDALKAGRRPGAAGRIEVTKDRDRWNDSRGVRMG